jgi:adenosine kinase
MAQLSKQNPSRPRTVICTRGADSTLVVSRSFDSSSSDIGDDKYVLESYDVPLVAKDDIVDTNGAGDMFSGGLLAALILGKTIGEAVQVGHRLGGLCIREVSRCPT